MELSAASTPAGGTQGHHATGNGVLWRMLVAGLLALSVGAEIVDVATLWSLALSQKMLGRVVWVAPSTFHHMSLTFCSSRIANTN